MTRLQARVEVDVEDDRGLFRFRTGECVPGSRARSGRGSAPGDVRGAITYRPRTQPILMLAPRSNACIRSRMSGLSTVAWRPENDDGPCGSPRRE